MEVNESEIGSVMIIFRTLVYVTNAGRIVTSYVENKEVDRVTYLLTYLLHGIESFLRS